MNRDNLERLFVYGSLRPGGPNEPLLTAIGGEWEAAVVRGKLLEKGWGAGMGYPGLTLDDQGAEVPGYVFSSPNLGAAWEELDRFEGDEYERVRARVTLSSGAEVDAYVYVVRAR